MSKITMIGTLTQEEIDNAAPSELRAEVSLLREQAEELKADNDRLRRILDGALVPCPACFGKAWIGQGRGEKERRCVKCFTSRAWGFIPVEMAP